MRRLYFLAALFTGCMSLPIKSIAQDKTLTYLISGKIVDQVSQQPIPELILRVELKKKLVSNGYSQNGLLSILVPDTGTYFLTIYRMGYVTKEIMIKVDQAKPETALGTISLSPATNTLKEIEVTGKRPLIKQQIDRIVYDVQADTYMKSLNAFDALKRVPLISITNRSIGVKGNNNITILINGRRTIANSNPVEYLSNLDAANIQSIEVITDPSVKYDAESGAAIINIITLKTPLGYRVSSSGFIRNPEYYRLRTAVDLNFKKFNASISLTPFRSVNPTGFSQIEISSGPDVFVKQYGQNRYNSNNFLGSIELGYNLDSLSLIAADFSIISGKYNRYSRFDSELTDLGGADQSYVQLINGLQHRSTNSVNVNYQRALKNTKGDKINLSYYFGSAKNDNENENLFSNLINYNPIDFDQHNLTLAKEHSGQLDYAGKKKSFSYESGVKAIFRTNLSDYFNRSRVTTSKYNEGNFKLHQNIFSLYGSLQFALDKRYALRLGARLENTDINIHGATFNDQVDNNYLSFIPNLLLQRTFANNKQLKFGYARSISRPGISYLNPFTITLNQNQTTVGNPRLSPVNYHKLSLEYSSYNKTSLSIGLNYNLVKGEIAGIARPLANGVTEYSYQNIGSKNEIRGNLSVARAMTKKAYVSLNGYLSYLYLDGKINNEDVETQGFAMFSNLLFSYKLTSSLNFDAYLVYATPEVSLQIVRTRAFLDNSFGLSKTLLKRSMSINFTVENPLMKYRRSDNEIVNPAFTQYSLSKNMSRAYSLTVSYRFGKINTIKKVDKKISTTDIIESSQ